MRTAHTGHLPLLIATAVSLLFCSCSMQKWALGKVAGALSGEGGTVFTGEEDPLLLADALPFALKTYESLLQSLPDDDRLLLATGKGFCTYAFAAVHLAADTTSDSRLDEKNALYLRAKKLYLRSRDYCLRAMELRHPGIRALLDADSTDKAVALLTPADTTLIYWTASSWMGAFTCDKFDMQLTVSYPRAVALMRRLLAFNPCYGSGAAHEFFTTYLGSLPASMGGSEELARGHFDQAVTCSRGQKAGPYLALATSICVAKQYGAQFDSLITLALAIDPDALIDQRLVNILAQARARWLAANRSNFFLDDPTTGDEEP